MKLIISKPCLFSSEAEYAAIRQVKCIPCYMEKPLELTSPLDFLIGANAHVDFSDLTKYNESFQELVRQISSTEGRLTARPRTSPPTSVGVPPVNLSNAQLDANAQFDDVARTFKTWVEDNRQMLQRTSREQSMRLVQQLLRNLHTDGYPGNDKDDLLRHLLSEILPSASNVGSFSPTSETLKALLVIMALWAVKAIFDRV